MKRFGKSFIVVVLIITMLVIPMDLRAGETTVENQPFGTYAKSVDRTRFAHSPVQIDTAAKEEEQEVQATDEDAATEPVEFEAPSYNADTIIRDAEEEQA